MDESNRYTDFQFMYMIYVERGVANLFGFSGFV